ncbi:MAG: DUF1599 domain-containing protein [Saprospiraceae bacterium]|nr:DUF1599 domain-containing protein [Saprospiraceae bacterium]
MSQTSNQYDQVIHQCRDIFFKKNEDYGMAWRILRPSSLTDQLYIKAKRIRSIEEKESMKIDEAIEMEFIGIINYCVMALIQLESDEYDGEDMALQELKDKYNHWIIATKGLMMDKNHDYGEAWRDMRVSSMTDLILMKLLRIKSIEENDGKTIISEGLDANYQDIINYAVFALIKLEEEKI